HAIPTPAIQRLAGEGVLFRKCFCAAPTCSASRAALVTGQSSHSAGMLGLVNRGFRIGDYKQHVIHALKGAGYASTLVGVQHIGKADEIGYDRVLKPEKRGAEGIAGAAADFLRGRPEEPFFLTVGFIETHRKFREPGPAEDERYCAPPAPLPDTPEARRDMAAFKASARVLDDSIGTVLGALDESGLAGNTLVVCTTDHGIAFPGMKSNLTDHGIGVMLVMRGPGGFTGGRVVDALVSHVDVYPTLCELAGVEVPGWVQGKSMTPLVNSEGDQAIDINDAIFAGVTYHAAYEPMRCVRTKRWKYIRRFGDHRKVVLPNCDDGPAKSVWVEHGWGERVHADEELYDVVFDPNETNNVAADPALAEALVEMRARLDRWMKDTRDPLLEGPAPAPSGAHLNDPDGKSPGDPQRTVP
ncbi:MAG: sulfatase family protein, partial [Planctomycetota bacterium]